MMQPQAEDKGSRYNLGRDSSNWAQLHTRVPKPMYENLRSIARTKDISIRKVVEHYLALGLETEANGPVVPSQPGTKVYAGPVPPHLTVVGPCVGHGTSGYVWCIYCSASDSPVPAEHCYLVIEACTRPGCTVQYKWPVCPPCLAALPHAIAYLCLNCRYALGLNRQLVERGQADSTEIGRRIDAFLKIGQDLFTDAEEMKTGRPQSAPHGSIPVLTIDHLRRLTSVPLIRLLDTLQGGPIGLADAKRIARRSANVVGLLSSVHGVLIDLDVEAARVAPLVGWPDLPSSLRVRQLLAKGVSSSHIRAILAAHIAGPITSIRHLSRVTGMDRDVAREAHAYLADLDLLSVAAPERDPSPGDGDA